MCKCAIVSMHDDCTKVHGWGILRGTCAMFICSLCFGGTHWDCKKGRGRGVLKPNGIYAMFMCNCAIWEHEL